MIEEERRNHLRKRVGPESLLGILASYNDLSWSPDFLLEVLCIVSAWPS